MIYILCSWLEPARINQPTFWRSQWNNKSILRELSGARIFEDLYYLLIIVYAHVKLDFFLFPSTKCTIVQSHWTTKKQNKTLVCVRFAVSRIVSYLIVFFRYCCIRLYIYYCIAACSHKPSSAYKLFTISQHVLLYAHYCIEMYIYRHVS